MAAAFLMVVLALAAEAFVLDGRAQETNGIKIADVSSPPQITAPPRLPELLRRDVQTVLVASDNICGYFNGSSASPYSCVAKSETCAIFTTSGGGVPACCNSDDCFYYTACKDYADVSGTNPGCTGSCLADTLTLKCTGTSYPYCGSVQFTGGALNFVGTNGISDYYCVSTNSSTVAKVATQYSGQVGGGFFGVQLTLSESISVPTTKPSTTSTPTTGFSTISPTPTHTPEPAASASAPIGAIVGGVIGGVALLAAIGFGIWYIRRHNHSKAASVAAVADSPAAGAQHMPSPGPGSPPPMTVVPGQQQAYYTQSQMSPAHTGQDQKSMGFIAVTPNAMSPNTTGNGTVPGVPDRASNMSPMSAVSELENVHPTTVHEMPHSPVGGNQAHELA